MANAKAFESRIYAPCCYGGTLDMHDSEIARDLRKEIETRLQAGEGTDAIQADLVGRYGDKILAARSDRPIERTTYLLVLMLLGAAIGLGALLRRWTHDSRPALAAEGPRDAMDDRIDADLEEIDS